MIRYNNLVVKKLKKLIIYLHMLIVEIKNNDSLERALKTLKSKVIRTKQQQVLNERKEYIKKSVKERSKYLKAVYVQKKKLS